MKATVMSDELYHVAGTGQERANHKYKSRQWVNGRWVYEYDLDETNAANSRSNRNNASQLDETGRKLWNYAKEQINDDKAEDTSAAKEDYDKRVNELRENAAQRKEQIQEQMAKLNETINDHLSAAIANLYKNGPEGMVPDGKPSAQMRRMYSESRKARAAELRKDAKGNVESNRKKAASQIKSITSELQSAVDKAKSDYKKNIASIGTETQNKLNDTYDRILSTHKKQTATKAKTTSSQSKKSIIYYN